MFSCCSSDPEKKVSKKRSKNIDSVLSRDRETYFNEIRLLLLGAGESGKSTFFKQMRIIHKAGYNPAERMRFKKVISVNILQDMKRLIEACSSFRIPLASPDAKRKAESVAAIEDTTALSPEVAAVCHSLWQDPGIQKAFGRRHLFQIGDSAPYFFSELPRIGQSQYVPTQSDILHARARTTGINEMRFTYEELHFRLVDVGGQRTERRKWIHVFEGVTAVIFFVALSEFDQVLAEDETQNRMRESLLIFEEVVTNKYFSDTSFILFLNKVDLFREKIQRKNITCAFPDYTGPQAFDSAAEFIASRFQNVNVSTEREIFVQLSCSTDTDYTKRVFIAVSDIILRMNLRRAGISPI